MEEFSGGVKEEKALLTTEFLESDFYKSNAKEEIIRIEQILPVNNSKRKLIIFGETA